MLNLGGFQTQQCAELEREQVIRRQILLDNPSQSGLFSRNHQQYQQFSQQSSSQNPTGNLNALESLQIPQLTYPGTFMEPIEQQKTWLQRNETYQLPSHSQLQQIFLRQQQEMQQMQQLQMKQQTQMWIKQQQELLHSQQQHLRMLSQQQEYFQQQEKLQQYHLQRQLSQTQQEQYIQQYQQKTSNQGSEFRIPESSTDSITFFHHKTEISKEFQLNQCVSAYQQTQSEEQIKVPQQIKQEESGQYQQSQGQYFQQRQDSMTQQFQEIMQNPMNPDVTTKLKNTLQMLKVEEISDKTELIKSNQIQKNLEDTYRIRQSIQEQSQLGLANNQVDNKSSFMLKSEELITDTKQMEDQILLFNTYLNDYKQEQSISKRELLQSTSSMITNMIEFQSQGDQQGGDIEKAQRRTFSQQLDVDQKIQIKQQELKQCGSQDIKIKKESLELPYQGFEDKTLQKISKKNKQETLKCIKKRREIKPYKIVKLKTLPKEDQLRNYILAQETKNVSKNICLRLSKFATEEKTKFSSIAKLREYLLRNTDKNDAKNMIEYLQYEFLIDIAHQTRNKTKIIYAKYRLKFINGLKDLENFKQLKF